MKIQIEIPEELISVLKSKNGNIAKYIESVLLTPLMEEYRKLEIDVLLKDSKLDTKIKQIRAKVKSKEL
jgi:hypothetical protein